MVYYLFYSVETYILIHIPKCNKWIGSRLPINIFEFTFSFQSILNQTIKISNHTYGIILCELRTHMSMIKDCGEWAFQVVKT